MSSLTVRTEMARAILARGFPRAVIDTERRLRMGFRKPAFADVMVREEGVKKLVVRLNGGLFPKVTVMPRSREQRPMAEEICRKLKEAGLSNPRIEEMPSEHKVD